MTDNWYVYMVRCANDALYCGISTDVEARVAKHNSGKGAKSIHALGCPVVLVFKTYAGTMRDALAMERLVKSLSKVAKEKIVGEHGL